MLDTKSARTDQVDASLGVDVRPDHLAIEHDGVVARFHHVWLRDNCGCPGCRVAQSGERALFTATIRDDIAPVDAQVEARAGTPFLEVQWNDGHASSFAVPWLLDHDYSNGMRRSPRHEPVLWEATLASVPSFEHDDVVSTTEGQIAYLDAVRDYGVAVVRNTPAVDGEVERFAEKIGYVRQTAFERIHNVRHDPAGYNVAHTPVELKPHTDLPSYHWPPSIQLLHFVVNDAVGGESTVTDGWAVVADLRRQDPETFETLCRVPVTYQLYSLDEDTYATAPMIQLDHDGNVRTFRFSNQLAQPLSASFEEVGAFYAAYRRLARMIDGDGYKVAFKAQTGDLLTVHGHRVMHGRLSFDPTSGARHLQDVYMDYDDFIARARVLSGNHIPTPSTEAPSHG